LRRESSTADFKIDVQTFGFFGRNQTISTFNGIDLPAPALNVSAFYMQSYDVYGFTWIDPTTHTTPFSNHSLLTMAINNSTYSATYMQQHGNCQQISTYKWGFAFLILYILVILLLVWSIGMFLTWLQACLTLDFFGNPQTVNDYKAILDLATAIRREFVESGQDSGELTDNQIKEYIKVKRRGGAIGAQRPQEIGLLRYQ
jgi:hypothetical protein